MTFEEETRNEINNDTGKYKKGYMEVYGEVFFSRCGTALCKKTMPIFIKRDNGYTEGQDADYLNIRAGIRNGSIEVKTINSVITRNNHLTQSGLLPFELFSNGNYAGWLLSMYSPEQYNQIKEQNNRPERAKRPTILAFILWSEVKQKPFVCIVFENVIALLQRLIDICPDAVNWGLSFNDITTQIPYKQNGRNNPYWQQWRTSNNCKSKWGILVADMWHVPLDQIADLATITMIENNIDVAEEWNNAKYRLDINTSQKRMEYLEKQARQNGRGHFVPPKNYTEHAQVFQPTQRQADILTTTGVKMGNGAGVLSLTGKEYNLEEIKAKRGVDY